MICPNCHSALKGDSFPCRECGYVPVETAKTAPKRAEEPSEKLADKIHRLTGKYLPDEAPPRGVSELPHTFAAEMFQSLFDKVAIIHIDGATGTGFFFRDGLIGTNAHVVVQEVEDGLRIAPRIVIEHRKKAYPAKVVNIDVKQDVAVLAFEGPRPEDIASLCNQLGNSHELMPGDEVISIGNSLGYGLTFNKFGIKDQVKYLNAGPYSRFREIILMNGTAQHGNSGGPLYNIKGEVVGMLTGSPCTPEEVLLGLPDGVLPVILNAPEPGVCHGVTVETLLTLL